MKLITLSLIGYMLLATTGRAASRQCELAGYHPQNIYNEIVGRLAAEDIAVVDAGLALGAAPTGTLSIVRASQIVGRLQYRQDVRAATAELTLSDAAGKILFHADSSESLCDSDEHRGICRTFNFNSELEPMLNEESAFALSYEADGVVPHFTRYGSEVFYYEWKPAFDHMAEWLIDTLTHTEVMTQLVLKEPRAKLFWAFSASPAIVPYLDRIHVEFAQNLLILSGTLPSHFVYDAIIRQARAAGYINVKPMFVIDERTRVEPVNFYPECR